MTSSSARDGLIPDGCPRCGERMVPVMDGDPARADGPLLAEPPVRLVCPVCSDGAA